MNYYIKIIKRIEIHIKLIVISKIYIKYKIDLN